MCRRDEFSAEDDLAFFVRFDDASPTTLNLHERLLLPERSPMMPDRLPDHEQVKPAILAFDATELAAETARPKSFRPILGGQ